MSSNEEMKWRAQNAIPTVGNIPMFRPSRIIMDVDAGQILRLTKYKDQLMILACELTVGSRQRSIFMDEVSRVNEFIKKQRIVDLSPTDNYKSLYSKHNPKIKP